MKIISVLFWSYVLIAVIVFLVIEMLFITIGDDFDLTLEQREYAKRWNNCRKHWKALKIAVRWPSIFINAAMDGEL